MLTLVSSVSATAAMGVLAMGAGLLSSLVRSLVVVLAGEPVTGTEVYWTSQM
jgi:hypothetical protein